MIKVFLKIIMLSLVLFVIFIIFCEINKAYWDHKVKEFCEKDGGVTVYEQITLAKDEYENLVIPFDKEERLNTPYYRITSEYLVISKYPKVGKSGQKIIRREDGKTLGVLVHYGRSGGDFLVIDHPTHYGCENIKTVNNSLTKSIFLIKEEKL